MFNRRNESVSLIVDGAPLTISTCSFGEGPAVLFVHGWGQNKEIWSRIGDLFAEAGFTAFTFDLPGYGNSSLAPDRLRSIEGYAKILEILLRYIRADLKPELAICDSLGALIFLDGLMSRRIKGFKGVVLSGCPLDGLPLLLRMLVYCGAIRIGLRLIQTFPTRIAKLIVGVLMRYTVKRRKGTIGPILRAIKKSDPCTSDTLLRAMTKPSWLRSIVVPEGMRLLFIRGAQDRIVSELTQKKWAARFGANEREMPGIGHTPMLEDAQTFFDEVFLGVQ